MDSQDLLEKMAFTLSKLLILHFGFFTNLRAKSTKMSKKKKKKSDHFLCHSSILEWWRIYDQVFFFWKKQDLPNRINIKKYAKMHFFMFFLVVVKVHKSLVVKTCTSIITKKWEIFISNLLAIFLGQIIFNSNLYSIKNEKIYLSFFLTFFMLLCENSLYVSQYWMSHRSAE